MPIPFVKDVMAAASPMLPDFFNFIGSEKNNQTQLDIANNQTKKDYDFAQNALQWRVADARKAGLHPLAALGAQVNSPSSVSVGTENSLGHLGQGIKSALDSISNKKLNELQLEEAQENVKQKKLQNEITAAQLAVVRQPGLPSAGTGFMPGQSQSVKSPRVQEKPLTRTTPHPKLSHLEPGAIIGGGFEKTPTGLAPVPSGDIKERLEDSPYELRHFWKYGVLPNFGSKDTQPPLDALPKGYNQWKWNIQNQEWQPSNKSWWEKLEERHLKYLRKGPGGLDWTRGL